jgi:hypothetical protein
LQKPNYRGKAEALAVMKNNRYKEKQRIILEPKKIIRTVDTATANVSLPIKLRLLVNDSPAEDYAIYEEAA